jgi:3,4-dihydroxy-2-butanone 4-phosphate synthase
METDSVWPSSTATRLQWALMRAARGTICLAVQAAEQLQRLFLHLLFFVLDEGDDVAEDVHRSDAGIAGAETACMVVTKICSMPKRSSIGLSAMTRPMAEQLGLVTM